MDYNIKQFDKIKNYIGGSKNNKDNKDSKEKITVKNVGERKSINIYQGLKHLYEPVKVILQYKNKEGFKQYIVYIFVGKLGEKTKSIFDKIKDKSLKDSLMILSNEEENKLIEMYGDFWQTKFFNTYHISKFVNEIEKDTSVRKELLKKYDDKWINTFIDRFTTVLFKKINYSYGELIDIQYKTKMGKKIEKIELDSNEVENLTLSTKQNLKDNILYNVSKELKAREFKQLKKNKDENIELELKNKEITQTGGEEDIQEIEETDDDINTSDIVDIENIGDTDDITNIYNEIKEKEEKDEKSEKINVESLEKEEDIEALYKNMDDVDKNVKDNSKRLLEILDNNKLVEKRDLNMIKFDDKYYDKNGKELYHDNDYDTIDLADVYEKKFIYLHYLYKDDTIKTIKSKITASIKNNDKYGDNNYIIPTRMYLWSEYLIGGKLEKVMIGHKWLIKNKLLEMDIEPLSVNKYANMTDETIKIKNSLITYSGRITTEDENSLLLLDYDDYMLNNEIYMVDIYNELYKEVYNGDLKEYKEYDTTKLDNIANTYLKLYFPGIKREEMRGIIEYINGREGGKDENLKIKNTFDTLYNDLLIEREITNLIELTKMTEQKRYEKLFEDGNYITNSLVTTNLHIIDDDIERENEEIKKMDMKENRKTTTQIIPKLDLFRIYNDFKADMTYPFIQYQQPNGTITLKYYEKDLETFTKEKNNIEMVHKWFENTPYGLSFKIKIQTSESEKYMSININDIGKLDYKTVWKEEDKANILDVMKTYDYVRDLIMRINNILLEHPKKVSIKIPEDYEFRFAYVNCIQKFRLPDNKIISHNDLRDFSRYFYPYVSMITEPKKRESSLKDNDKSKYGTYLKYKRVSKYDSDKKIRQRIITYIRNFDFEDDVLIEEISKQFSITTEKAKEQIQEVRKEVGIVSGPKKSIKMAEVPKAEPMGINIDIQGKNPEKYKIRISGARDKDQLERIITFMNILIYLYGETYILKIPERQEIKQKLKELQKIAKSRSKVEEIVDYQKEVKIIKQMTQIDKKRLGFKPTDKDQNQWSRCCQNSGNDKKRRPTQIMASNVQELIQRGYVLNKKTGEYEKKITEEFIKKKIKDDNVRKVLKKNLKDNNGELILRPLKVSAYDEVNNTEQDIYYACDPEAEYNGQHMFVGFLTKCVNPFGECMPCCFKKNPMGKKGEMREFHEKCLKGNKVEKEGKKKEKTEEQGLDLLYILQDNIKVNDNRMSYLPKYVDMITNILFNRKKKIKNNYLSYTEGYYFKLGIYKDGYTILDTISKVIDKENEYIKKKIIEYFKDDKKENKYIRLNDGDIRTEFTRSEYIEYIKNTEKIDYYYIKDVLKIENLFTKNGIYPIVFTRNINNDDMKEDEIDYYLEIDDSLINDLEYNMEEIEKKDILLMVKDRKYYYPITEIIKLDENNKDIEMKKLYKYDKDKELIDEIKIFIERTIRDVISERIKNNLTVKEVKKVIKHKIIKQILDSRNKTKYIILDNNLIVPVYPSGILDEEEIEIVEMEKVELKSIEETRELLEKMYKESDKRLNIKPLGLFYDEYDKKKNEYNIIGIWVSSDDLVPVKPKKMSKKELEDKKIEYKNRPLYNRLDEELSRYDRNNIKVIDRRVKEVNENKYEEEGYQLFRFELSNIIMSRDYKRYLEEIKKNIESRDKEELMKIIKNICGIKIGEKDKIGTELVKLLSDIPDTTYYKVENQRYICNRLDKDKCEKNIHCKYHNSKCYYATSEQYLGKYISRIVNELLNDDIRRYEILREKKYYVDDIVDHNNFNEYPGQKIIKSSSTNVKKILVDLFGKEHIPKIGKRYMSRKYEIDMEELKSNNPIKDLGEVYKQNVLENNYSIMRGYVNGYYWIKHELYNINIRNLGYYNEIQNELINKFRSIIIDWLMNNKNIEELIELEDEKKEIINKKLLENMNKENARIIINKYISELMTKELENNLGLFEMYILNKIHGIKILVMINGLTKYLIDGDVKKMEKEIKEENMIVLNMELHQNMTYPYTVEVIYNKKNKKDKINKKDK